MNETWINNIRVEKYSVCIMKNDNTKLKII